MAKFILVENMIFSLDIIKQIEFLFSFDEEYVCKNERQYSKKIDVQATVLVNEHQQHTGCFSLFSDEAFENEIICNYIFSHIQNNDFINLNNLELRCINSKLCSREYKNGFGLR